MYKLAPIADSLDMFIALGICYLPIILFIILAYVSHRSGSQKKEQVPGAVKGLTRWVKDEGNIPFYKNAWFHFALAWLLLGSIFFWLILWPDHHDVWFIITEK